MNLYKETIKEFGKKNSTELQLVIDQKRKEFKKAQEQLEILERLIEIRKVDNEENNETKKIIDFLLLERKYEIQDYPFNENKKCMTEELTGKPWTPVHIYVLMDGLLEIRSEDSSSSYEFNPHSFRSFELAFFNAYQWAEVKGYIRTLASKY